MFISLGYTRALHFTLGGIVFVLTMVIGYVVCSYSVFRGKAGKESYYE